MAFIQQKITPFLWFTAQRAMQAMMKMVKLDIAVLQKAVQSAN